MRQWKKCQLGDILTLQRGYDFILIVGFYLKKNVEDVALFEEKMERLTGELLEKLKEYARLLEQTCTLLRGISYEI